MKINSLPFATGLFMVLLAQAGIINAALLAFSKLGWNFAQLEWQVVGSLLLLNVGAWLSYTQFKALKESSRRLRLLADMNVQVNREILLNEDIELIYRTVLNYLFSVFKNATSGSVLILGEDNKLSFAASRGFNEEFVNQFHLRLEDSFLYQLTEGDIKETRLIRSDHFKQLETVFMPPKWQYQSAISAPIFVADRLFGLLNLDSSTPGMFNQDDVDTVDRFRTQIEIILLARERYTQSIKRYQVDALTGLLTRRYFEDLFKLNLERAQRHKETFLIAMFDVDKLKYVNDTFGHLAGDQMLLAIANALRSASRSSDVVGRLGGDEFIACYPLAGKMVMDKTIASIRSKVRASRLKFAGVEHRPSFSYGLAAYPEDGTDLETLIAVADERLYDMKAHRTPSFRDTLPFAWAQ